MSVIVFGVALFLYSKNIGTNNINLESLQTKQIIPWGVKSINVQNIWPKGTGNGIKVAVFDSGINFRHPDFGKNIETGYNAIEPNQLPIDDNGHGTLVSGVIISKNNGFGVVGVAPDVELYPVKVLDKYGEGDISAIVKGIDWCIKNNIRIINMSFAIDKDVMLLRDSIKRAVDSGIIIVASASNTYGGSAEYPASYNNVISVTAVNEDLKICKTAPKGKIDFSAPGGSIISTSSNGKYEEFSGTSLAAPYVTGIISLILENSKDFDIPRDKECLVSDMYNILKKLSIDLGPKGKDSTFGEGFISFSSYD